ncbi:MAG: DUF4037 domain-containing protein [Anaerolineae bacterium]|nr:DUF4037 domain-containing protein [Anaerolineae bacterium]
MHGIELSELLYWEGVRPVLDARFPGLPHAAARLDYGSDVLGYDTPQSMDHDWGPKLTLYLADADHDRLGDAIDEALSSALPREVRGYSTSFGHHDDGTTVMQAEESGPIYHQVQIRTVRSFFVRYLGYDPSRAPELAEWLAFPQQRLCTIASGRVFHDGIGELEPVRERLRYYPHDVWLYLLEAQWARIAQLEPFMARCGDVGDELGSRLIAARLVREVMALCFLIERQYAPYAKWFGTAFARLSCAARMRPAFDGMWRAATWRERETHLSTAYTAVAEMHNALGITHPLRVDVVRFHARPYMVIDADRFARALRAAIVDPAVRALPAHVGSVDQFVDSTDVLDHLGHMRRLRAIYG